MSSLKYKFGFILGLLLVSGNFVSSQSQEESINCYACEGDDCAASVGLLRSCEREKPQQCVIVFDSDSTVVSRGCSGEITKTQADYCGNNNKKCISCSSNGCNVATALSDFIQCLSCDSTTDRNCALNPDLITSTKLCYKSCMTSLYVKNLTDTTPTYELLRSCLDDKDLPDKVACSNGEDELCQACDGEKCNVARIPKESFRCYSCSGDDCMAPISEECVSQVENDQCYFLFDEKKDLVQMGCRSEFDEDEVVAKIKDQKLLLCDGSDCNNFNNFPQPRDCYKCDSATDENCAIEPMSVESFVTCGIPYTQCYTKVSVSGINAGVTVRGCLSDLQGDEFYDCLMNADKKCQSCSGSDCNQKIVPEDRIKCQRCSSESDSSCHKNPSELGLCPIYSQNETCVSVYTNGVTQRGCGTEFTCNSSNSKSCQICSSTGCNVDNVKKASEEIYGIFQDLPLKCYTCEGDECERNGGELRKCEGSIYQDCITVFNEDGKVIRRGCEVSVEAEFSKKCDANPELCFNCKANGCNTITRPTEFVECTYCDSANDPNCVRNVSVISKQRKCAKGCVTALYPRSGDESIFELVRTCLDDIEIDDIDSCGGDFKCDKCSESKCNNIAMPDVRLSCNTCETSYCDNPVSKECTAFSENDQCFMLFDETLSVSRMGCKSELSAREIQTSVKQLFLCDGVNCNNYENLPKGNICSFCNSTNYISCATAPADVLAIVRCNTYPFTQCYSKVSSDGSTERGCLSWLEVEEFLECLENDSPKCETCVGKKCNSEIFPANRQSCQRCNSLEDSNCESLPSASGICPLYSENDTCVTKIVDGITFRDCGSEISCGTLGRRNCRTCTESDCNTVDLKGESIGDPGLWQDLPINCYTCDGEECATSIGLLQMCVGDKNQLCSTVFSLEGKVIARGCSDSIDARHGSYCHKNPSDCLECKSSGCNLATDKADYVDCIFCNAQSNVNCTENVAEVSRIRKCHKACMTALYPRTSDVDASYELTRSCLDDKDLDDQENCDSDPLCYSCSGTACNTQLIPEVRKTCHHCKGASCQTSVISPCRSYTKREQCFILFDEVSSVHEMGCKSDYDPSEIQSLIAAKRLFLCDDDNCNGFESIPTTSTCWLCNSRTDKFCATNPKNVASSMSCTKLPFTECYTRVLEDGHTERGCLSSLEGDQFLECYNNSSDLCSVCAEGRCNDKIFPLNRLSCHICNSAEDSGCDVTPKYSSVCHTYSSEQTCITTINDDIVQRGCSEELTCDLNDRTSCRACNTTDCNVINLKRFSDVNPGFWQDLPLNCYSCAGDECVDTSTRLNVCTDNAYQYCMTVFDEKNRVVRRGCSDDVEADFGDYCDENSEKCFNCNSNGCNNAARLTDYINCIYCDSRSNKNCVLDVSAVLGTRKCHKSCMVALFPKSENETSLYELSRSCLDDKDLDDRELCNTDGSYCKSCNSITCNVEDIVEDRLECFSCLGESCVSPVSALCTVYAVKPTCFMLFDADNTVQRMGCTSELNIMEIEENIDKLFTCSGKNCNDFSNIPKPQTCAECDSSSDVVCATNPISIGRVTTCSSLPHTNCYTRIKSDGTTARGCVSNLSKSLLLECLDSNSTSCTSCIGNRCNIEIFPEDRLRCHKCNSIDDPTCQDAPNAAVVCPLYLESEVCSSKLVNDVTYRACGDSFICDDSDKQYCKMCNSTNCNHANLYQNNIGYPGLWQEVPINCYTCFRDECDNSNTTLLRKCENNDRQNCITVFNMKGKVMERGCSDNIYNGFFDHHCDKHPDLCTYCKSSGCNDAKSLDVYVDCLFCDSTTNPNCTSDVKGVSRTRKCQKCMTAIYPRSDEEDPAYELSRSCLDDKDYDDRSKCANGNDEFCKSCEDDKCNYVRLPDVDRLSCLQCSGDGCVVPIEAECSAFRENDRCYILFDDTNTVQRMGCGSDLDSSVIAAFRKKLLFCDGDNCNTFDKVPSFRTCLVCDSANDTLCATNPNSILDFKICNSLPYTSCYIRIEDGLTKRGCLADIEIDIIDECIQNGDDVKCKVCNTEHCNVDVYPVGRRSCHRCSSENDSNCQSIPNNYSVCPVYEENDKCVVEVSNHKTTRGCTSDFSCNIEDRVNCRICSTDNCNTVDLQSSYVGEPGQWQDLPLTCYECEGSTCESLLGDQKKCENNNLQNCMTVFDLNATVVKRGCSDDVIKTHEEYCDENGGRCQSCRSSRCNTAISLDDYVNCIFCDSSTNPNCVLNPSVGTSVRKCHKQCMVALFPRSSEENPAYELTRTCLDDKDLKDRDSCATGTEEHCQACSKSGCNNFALPVDRHQCWTCEGDNCDDAQVQDCISYHPEDQCYILFNNLSSIISMGCRSKLPQQSVTSLIQAKSLLLCDGKNCNSYDTIPNSQTCVACNSATDPRCATNPNLIPDVVTCSVLPYTGCVTRINEDGDTVRGCQTSLSNLEFYGCHTSTDAACSTCSGNKCNADVFPADRLKCHRCNSKDDEKCAESPASNGVCPKITEGESCVVAYIDGVTHRGCSSELSCNATDKGTCRVCTGSACNTHNLENIMKDGQPGKWQQLPLNCFICEGESCKDSYGLLNMCSNSTIQNCMTVFNTNDSVIQRGCSNDVLQTQDEWCELNSDKCYRCNSNGCNIAYNMDDYIECLSCDTSLDGACVKNSSSLIKTRKCYKFCMTALYPRSSEENPAYDTIRSCLDDKDFDERDSCKDGSEDLCSACDNNKCNVDDLRSDRRSCYHCSGNECESPKQELCAGYRPNDQCYIKFDETQTIIGMGCRSEFTIAHSIELIKTKQLLLCDKDNCNYFDGLPASQFCALCNSKTDVNCAINPSEVKSSTSCSSLPYTQCYSRVLNDGATERGCLSSLSNNEFYDCLIGNSTTCLSCTGSNCNKEIYPADRISCHVCDSSSDLNCESSPDSLSICAKYQENETCATSFNGIDTIRNCGASLKCDTSSPRKCRICDSTGCNIADLASIFDDNFGKWQDLPLSCFDCEGDDCKKEHYDAVKCEFNNEQDCSTVFSAVGQVIRRGCSDKVEREYINHCDANPELCFGCKSNECNNATALTEFIECIYCDSKKDTTCVSNPLVSTFKTRQCQGSCMVALYPSDSSSNPAYELIRTCLNDKESEDQISCNGGKDNLCHACTEDNCNAIDFPEGRLRCHSCLDDSCVEPASELCPLYKKDDQCFIRFDSTNSIVEMGCLSKFGGQEIADILKTKQVYICEGNDCNSEIPEPNHCSICDSAVDINCATNPLQVGNVSTCRTFPYTDCYTKITKAGTTQRGCLIDLPDIEFVQCIVSGGDQCTHCVGNGCNKEIFPENRLQCYSCTSDIDPECESLPTTTVVCPYVRDSERCVTSLSGNITERACSTDLLCDATDKSTCRMCSSVGCNTLDLANRHNDGNHGKWQDLPLRCHTCSGEQCQNSLGPALACKYGDEQDCLTVFNETGVVIHRGCEYDVEDEYNTYCQSNADKCLACKSNECNDAWTLDNYIDCVYCNSELDPTCATNPNKTGFPTRKCQKGCMAATFTALNGTTQIIRTCLDDKELPSRYQCSLDESEKECASCSERKCNSFKYPKDRLTCHVCQGTNCSDTVEQFCAAYDEDDKCFAKYRYLRVEISGCVSDIESSVLTEWKEENAVYICSGDNCNSPNNLPSSKKCVLCNSKDNVECATNPSAVPSNQMCSAPITACYSRIVNGLTHRGCLSSLDLQQQEACETDASGLCEVCKEDNCNNEVFPSDRRRCHICNTKNDDKCKAEPDSMSICPVYELNNSCVVKLTDGLTERGCSTDLTCDAGDDKHCSICNRDGCNTAQLDNGSLTIVNNNILLTFLVAFVSLMGVISNC